MLTENMKLLICLFFGLLIITSYLYYQYNHKVSNRFSNYEPVTTNNVAENPINLPTPTPIPPPTERSLRAAVGVFLLLNEETRKSYTDSFSENGDSKEAMINLAYRLDLDNEKLIIAESLIKNSGYTYKADYTDINTSTESSGSISYDNSSDSSEKSLKYNYMESRWEFTGDEETLKYNYMEDNYDYVPKNSSLKYDYMDNQYEYAQDDEKLKYNYMENEYEYTPDDTRLRYNYMENEYEYAGDDESLKYNYMEDTWSYE